MSKIILKEYLIEPCANKKKLLRNNTKHVNMNIQRTLFPHL